MKSITNKQSGAVSLFIVIFSALLITTITIAFVRVMIQGETQATMNNLSKNALDSAQAGIEDAKRAIVMYRSQCLGSSNDATSPLCVKLAAALTNGTKCDTIQQSGIAGVPGDSEVLIQQNAGDTQLMQAYTCVKVQLNTTDYVGSLAPNTSRLIPLKSDSPYDQITIEWYSQSDLQNGQSGDSAADSKVNLGLDASLPKLADWPSNRPALMRVQLIQYGSSFNLSDFDNNQTVTPGNTTSDNATLFLVPSSVGLSTMSFNDDVRQSHTSNALEQVRCDPDFSMTSTTSRYACKATIQLLNPIRSTDSSNRHAYLRINELYNTTTSFRVTMSQDSGPNSGPVLFSSVQPLVDSTGRANNFFRRIQSRIDLDGSSIPGSEASVDLTGSLCKTFLVTDQPVDYSPGDCQDSSTNPTSP